MASQPLAWLSEASIPTWSFILAALLFLAFTTLSKPSTSTIPSISGPIPILSSTLLYMTDMQTFLSKAKSALRHRNIVQFHLGPMKAYLISSPSNIATMFRATANLSSDIFFLLVQQHIWNATPDDLSKFAGDKSGRVKSPSNNDGDGKTRYWAGMHDLVHRYLARSDESNTLAQLYQQFFTSLVSEKFPLGKPTPVKIHEFLQNDMAKAAATAINGSKILSLTPDLLTMLWDFDLIASKLVWGLPKFFNPTAWKTRDRLLSAVRKYLESSLPELDKVHAADADWEPTFGSRYARNFIFWLRSNNFSPQTMAGAITNLTIFGANSNSIPVATWCVMEVARSPSLLEAIREEVETTYETDPATGERRINAQLLVTLPLLQSVYIEGLRLHVSMNVTRQVVGPMEVGGFKLEKGAVLQAATEISHYDEVTWGVEGHGAEEFWAERHVKWVDENGADGEPRRVRKFAMAGGPNDFFPYGGGLTICPGRFFAKQEIMLTIALLVSRFDIEFAGWVNKDDGSPSDRPAQNDVRWSGGAAVPPDRDMQAVFKRLW